MKTRLLALLLFAATAGLTSCIGPPEIGTQESPIFGGTVVPNPTADPTGRYLVKVTVQGSILCSGVLVSQEWVLTAAHCIWDTDHDARQGGIAVTTFAPGSSTPSVDRPPIVHPSYTPGFTGASDSDAVAAPLPYDVALIHLSSALAIPAPTPVEQFPTTGTPITCYGFGISTPGEESDGQLRQGDFTLGQLTTIDGTSFGVPQGYVTAPASVATLAFGDSGGPCFEPSADGTSPGKLTGIHSWAQLGAAERTGDMGVAYVYGWIAANTTDQIESVAATYGGNLGAPAGNATDTVGVNSALGPSWLLTGRASQAYGIDPTFLGDPYPGQSKDFVLSWTCGRFDTINGAYYSAPADGKSALASCPPSVTGLQVQIATYGQSCGAPVGNETAAVVAACDGRNSCAYTVDQSKLGNPAPGCAKDFSIGYVCAGGLVGGGTVSLTAEAAGKTLNLQCSPPCQPSTCAALGVHCGTTGDGCGGTLDCGGCSQGICSSGQCVCIPRTTCLGVCGTVSNGCGGTIQCPACPCTPSCSGKMCGGSNGCGGKCTGPCANHLTVCTQTTRGPMCLPPD